jgi:hypothetical protein
MTRRMFDGITAAQVPAGAQLYAGYLDGEWPSYAQLVAQHPGFLHVSITVFYTDNEGQVLDVESGDATPEQAVIWVRNRRAAGADPTVYCSMSTWPTVKAAFAAAGVAQPHYWVADYSLGSNPAIPAGAIALQYVDMGGYDISVVADYWPGVDPAPAAPTAVPEEIEMITFSVGADPANPSVNQGIWLLSGGLYVQVDNTTTQGELLSAGIKQVPIDFGMHQAIQAAIKAQTAQINNPTISVPAPAFPAFQLTGTATPQVPAAG